MALWILIALIVVLFVLWAIRSHQRCGWMRFELPNVLETHWQRAVDVRKEYFDLFPMTEFYKVLAELVKAGVVEQYWQDSILPGPLVRTLFIRLKKGE